MACKREKKKKAKKKRKKVKKFDTSKPGRNIF